MEKIAWDGRKWGREGLFPANPNLADILGDADFDFDNFYILDFLGSQNVQISRSQISKNLPLGQAWALGRAGPPGLIWKSGDLGSQTIQKVKNVKIKIRVAQNVGNVWISREKTSWPLLG